MFDPYRIIFFAISIIVSAGSAVGDWPLDPTTPAQRVSVGSRELIWTNTFAIMRGGHSENIEVIAEDSTSFQTWADGSTTGSKTNYMMESIVGPFVCFSLYSEGSNGRGNSKRWVKHLGSKYPDAGDIRGLFDEINIIETLGREYGIEFSEEDLQPGSLIRILGTFDELPCAIRRGLLDQWAVSEIGDSTATVSVVSEYCPNDSESSWISFAIPEPKRYFFDEAHRLQTTRTGLLARATRWNIRPSLYLRDVPQPWTVPWMPPPSEYREATMVRDGREVPVRWNNRGLEMLKYQTDNRWTTVFSSEYSVTDFGWSRDSLATVDRELVAIVGPLVTYREVRRSSDKHGSRISVQFRTENASKTNGVGWTPTPINAVFGDDEVIQALVQSDIVSPYVEDLAPESLREFGFRGDECGIFRHLLGSWAILDFADGRARVRITLPSTEEYCGDYHETFDIEVPVSEEWLEYVEKAKANSLLGVHLNQWNR